MKTKSLVRIAITLAIVLPQLFLLNIARAESPDLTYQDKFTLWLDKLEYAESNDDKMLVILDTNNRYSYGCLQFQMNTWLTYSRKYGIKSEIMDCTSQRSLAYQMIQTDFSAWRNWYTSTKHIGLPPRQ